MPNSREVQEQGKVYPDRDRKGEKDKHKGTEYTAYDTWCLIPLDLLNTHLPIHRSSLMAHFSFLVNYYVNQIELTPPMIFRPWESAE